MESSKPMEDIPEKKEEKRKEARKRRIYWYISILNFVDFKRFLKLLAKSVNMKEIHAVSIVLKSLGVFRKALKLEEAAELTTLLPLDDLPPQAIPPEIEKKYRITKNRLGDFSKMPEIKVVLHLLYIMKLIDSRNPKEVSQSFKSFRQ